MRGLAFRMAEKFRGVDAKVEKGRLLWAGRSIPWNPADRTIEINFAGPPGTFQFISLSDFIAAARAGNKDQIRKWVSGKAVLLGPDTIDDRHPTPFYTAFSGAKYNTAGVEIHASTLQTLLDGSYLVPVPYAVRVLALFFVAGATAAAAAGLAAAQTGYWIAAGIAATSIVTHMLFRYGVVFSTSELLLGCLISLLSSMVYRFLTAEKRGAFFQKAIKIFVGENSPTTFPKSRRSHSPAAA